MIKVIAKNFLKADKVDEFIVLAKKLVTDTRKNDIGCIKYQLLQDIKAPNMFTMIEEWQDNDALNKHMNSKHFKDSVVLFATIMEKPAEINIYKIVI